MRLPVMPERPQAGVASESCAAAEACGGQSTGGAFTSCGGSVGGAVWLAGGGTQAARSRRVVVRIGAALSRAGPKTCGDSAKHARIMDFRVRAAKKSDLPMLG